MLLTFFKTQRIIRKAVKEEDILKKLTTIFGTEFRMDWIGRIYTVINPHIQNIDGDYQSLIYQYNKDNTMSNDIAINQWVIKNMVRASDFINDNNFIDVLAYRIDKIDEDNNYLFVLENPLMYRFLRFCRVAAVLVGVLALLAAGAAILL